MLTYLDNNATTRVAPEVLDAMRPFLEDQFFNPSSAYESARGPAAAIRQARQTVAAALGGVAPDEILFTSCATESLNAALFGPVRANPARRWRSARTWRATASRSISCRSTAPGGSIRGRWSARSGPTRCSSR